MVGQDVPTNTWKHQRQDHVMTCDTSSLRDPHCNCLSTIHCIWENWPYCICSINTSILWPQQPGIKAFLASQTSRNPFLSTTLVWRTKFETHGYPFSEDYSCQADPETHSSISRAHKCAQRLCSCLRWRNSKEEICDSNFIPEASFIPKLAKSGWGRVWVWSSTGWTYNPMQRRSLHQSNLWLELLMSKEESHIMTSLKDTKSVTPLTTETNPTIFELWVGFFFPQENNVNLFYFSQNKLKTKFVHLNCIALPFSYVICHPLAAI